MKKNYTDKQLSLILTAHEDQKLVCYGAYEEQCKEGMGCINQIAFNMIRIGASYKKNVEKAEWFDNNYCEDMTPEELLENLEK